MLIYLLHILIYLITIIKSYYINLHKFTVNQSNYVGYKELPGLALVYFNYVRAYVTYLCALLPKGPVSGGQLHLTVKL